MKRLVWWMVFAGLFHTSTRAQDRFDVVISEIFADPAPQVGLPSSEWIELKNRSTASINLQGWRLADGNGQSGAFPSFTLQPDSAVIICTGSALTALSNFGTAISVTSFPSLDNDGEILYIRDPAGKIIHALNYHSSWYGNELKKQGGWSLEMIDPGIPCKGESNWKASEDPSGGTPGRKNSVDGHTTDDEGPELLRSYARDSLHVRLIFNEPLDSLSAVNLNNYSITGGITIINVITLPPLFQEVELEVSSPLAENLIYQITAMQARDCRGNMMQRTEVKTGRASFPSQGEWIINEILFNPRPNGYDYVEFFNNSNKIFDLSGLYIANRNGTGIVSSIQALSGTPFLVFPDEYVVATTNAAQLPHQYLVPSHSRVMDLTSFPSFPDDKGIVVTLDSRGIITDEVHYDEDWHFKLISDAEAVSLERISSTGISQEKMNWHSAASTAGYGTPGYKNSQYQQWDAPVSAIQVHPAVFSPDHDGREDLLLISYEMDEPGYMACITVFDAGGRAVRHLVRNELAGKNGTWKWDGLDNKGMKLPGGIYIIHAEFFTLSGTKETYKQAVVIAVP